MNVSFFQLLLLVIFCFFLFGDFEKVKINISNLKKVLLKFKNNQEK